MRLSCKREEFDFYIFQLFTNQLYLDYVQSFINSLPGTVAYYHTKDEIPVTTDSIPVPVPIQLNALRDPHFLPIGISAL